VLIVSSATTAGLSDKEIRNFTAVATSKHHVKIFATCVNRTCSLRNVWWLARLQFAYSVMWQQ